MAAEQGILVPNELEEDSKQKATAVAKSKATRWEPEERGGPLEIRRGGPGGSKTFPRDPQDVPKLLPHNTVTCKVAR